MGFELINKTPDTVEIKRFDGVIQKWEMVVELPFDPIRKRMSVIIRRNDLENSEYFILCKGADSTMMNRIEQDPNAKKNICSNFKKNNLFKLKMQLIHLEKRDFVLW